MNNVGDAEDRHRRDHRQVPPVSRGKDFAGDHAGQQQREGEIG
jgi:hypothetical protein